MLEGVSIRQAQISDLPALMDVREHMLRDLGADDPERLLLLREASLPWLERAFGEQRAAGWLAERGDPEHAASEHKNRVIGGVLMTFVETQPQLNARSGCIAQIYGLWVAPAERGVGVASALVRAAVDCAREHGAELATLHAAERARPLYERLGFQTSPEMRLFLKR